MQMLQQSESSTVYTHIHTHIRLLFFFEIAPTKREDEQREVGVGGRAKRRMG